MLTAETLTPPISIYLVENSQLKADFHKLHKLPYLEYMYSKNIFLFIKAVDA